MKGNSCVLLAEIHGKGSLAIQSSEDYLTSSVFGHLRLLQSHSFWAELFARTYTADRRLPSLWGKLEKLGVDVQSYGKLDVVFWPKLGRDEPDLVLKFVGHDQPDLVILIEAKLNAGKSGRGENDQLARYLSKFLNEVASSNCVRALIYLTPREATRDLAETLDLPSSSSDWSHSLFGATWQDIQAAAEVCSPLCVGLDGQLLDEVAKFLAKRNLVHFRGMTRSLGLRSVARRHLYKRRLWGTSPKLQIAVANGLRSKQWMKTTGK